MDFGMAIPPFIILLKVSFCFITSQAWGNIPLEVDWRILPPSHFCSWSGDPLGNHSCLPPSLFPWSPYSLPATQLNSFLLFFFYLWDDQTFNQMILVLLGLAFNGLPQLPVTMDHLVKSYLTSSSSFGMKMFVYPSL